MVRAHTAAVSALRSWVSASSAVLPQPGCCVRGDAQRRRAVADAGPFFRAARPRGLVGGADGAEDFHLMRVYEVSLRSGGWRSVAAPPCGSTRPNASSDRPGRGASHVLAAG